MGGTPGWEQEVLRTIALAAIREQRAARRWRIFFRLVWLIIFLAIVAGAYFFLAADKSAGGERHTALISVRGEISAKSEASSENIDAALEAAFADPNTAGIVLQINSPGGSPVEAGIVYRNIRRLRQAHPKVPLYAVIGDVGASGAYYIAAAADRIYVDPASIVGSIGVIMENFGFTGLMDKLGVERRVQTAGENKAIGDPFSPENPVQKQHIQQMLDQIHQQFIKAVKDGRGARLHETPDMFSGLFWTGEQSVRMGLADGFGDADSVARDVVKQKDVVDFSIKESLSDRVARRFGTAMGASAFGAVLDGAATRLR
ncbi:S49 family peptidase [Robbsia sp. Bb-Pol-6]|uniref:S49 family peptidase n=2 Tax=Robbsia betulipollinis TaxID=2981849 RepID=A0ABT3ZRJ8_9BURK|nr:S49 family peptidase [Robbsia betulipollinis]MCY0388565.1 S49 family peptidase [Robbsia betulipollinis]